MNKRCNVQSLARLEARKSIGEKLKTQLIAARQEAVEKIQLQNTQLLYGEVLDQYNRWLYGLRFKLCKRLTVRVHRNLPRAVVQISKKEVLLTSC
jgi:hypothetical protein